MVSNPNKQHTAPPSWKRFLVPVIIIALWGLGSANALGAFGQEQVCSAHWHASLGVNIEGEEIVMDNPYFNSEISHDFHLHNTRGEDPRLLHFHPGAAGPSCIPLEDAFDALEIDLSSSQMVLGQHHDQDAGTYAANDTMVLKFFVKHFEEDWQEFGANSKVLDRAPDNGDRYLLYYGVDDADAIMAAQDNVRSLDNDPSYPAGPQEGVDTNDTAFVTVTAFTLFAVIGLVVWRKFDKAAHP